MSTEELIEFLRSLPGERTREYELKITHLSMDHRSPELEQQLLSILGGEYPEQVHYNAFYCLHVFYRHIKDYQKLNSMMERYGRRFSRHITYDHLRALFYIESDIIYDYHTLLNITYKDATLFDDNAGFVHMFPVVFASVYERGGIFDTEAYISEWYDLALEAANHAIELDPSYAKYYCTKARVLTIRHHYTQAAENINTAISYEFSSRSDYALRISSYLYYKAMIDSDRKLYALEQKFLSLVENGAPAVHAPQAQASMPDLQPYKGNAPYLFVSYAHKDAPQVFDILEMLQKNGVRVWFDKDGIPASVDFTEYIAQRIEHCSKVLFMVSPQSVNADYVRMEIFAALENGKTPICVFLEETALSAGMRMQIGRHQHIFKYQMSDSAFQSALLGALDREIAANEECI